MKDKKMSCTGTGSIFGIIVLVLAILWILSDIGVMVLNVPWLPLIIAIVTIKMMVIHSHMK